MAKIINQKIIGTAIVFGVTDRACLYKVELSEVAGGGDYRMAACYEPATRCWRPCEMSWQANSEVMVQVFESALDLAPEAIKAWDDAFGEGMGIRNAQPHRIAHLLAILMERHHVPRKAIADRLGIRDLTLRDYANGQSGGAMGEALVLALEALEIRAGL